MAESEKVGSVHECEEDFDVVAVHYPHIRKRKEDEETSGRKLFASMGICCSKSCAAPWAISARRWHMVRNHINMTP